MNITSSLLYLLLLYAVLDKDNKKLSLTTGLVIAFVIMLLNCYFRTRCCTGTTTTTTTTSAGSNVFTSLNGF